MINNLQNLHTHTVFCDGKDTPEEMVKAAIEKGFSSLGFSSHSYMEWCPEFSLMPEDTQKYKNEIARLKDTYKGKIDIFCGIEFEKYSKIFTEDYDYVIGSVHYFNIGGKVVAFDRGQEQVQNLIDTYFGGDGMKCAKAYYAELATLTDKVKCDILGHFDLITKNNEKANWFDVESPEYLKYAYEAIDALKGKIPFFEINTGAISRGYRTAPYPTVTLLKRLLESGFLPMISSDCHNKDYLDCFFPEAIDMLEACGAKERYILTDNGYKAVSLR